MRQIHFVMLLAAAAAIAATATGALAAPTWVTIQDRNAWVRVSPDSQYGNDRWVTDGWNWIRKEWFWYRIDGPGYAAREASIDTLQPQPFAYSVDTNADGSADNLLLRYDGANAGLSVEVNYTLRGGAPGSGRSDLGTLISVTNTGREAKNIHFFEYAEFYMSDGHDTVQVRWPNTVDQGYAPWQVSEAVTTPVPTRCEVNLTPVILDSLNDAAVTTLSGATGPLTGTVAWALEWEFNLDPGKSYLISKDKSIVMTPEPATLALLGAGLLGLVARRRKK